MRDTFLGYHISRWEDADDDTDDVNANTANDIVADTDYDSDAECWDLH